jgi:hypothetical protein
MSNYDNSNQAILKQVVSDNPKAPKLRLELTINGVKYKAGLWPWTRKDGSPVQDKNGKGQYIGRVELDTYGQEVQQQGIEQAKQAAQNPVAAEFFDDDVPF